MITVRICCLFDPSNMGSVGFSIARAAGNGSIMRLAPVPIAYHSHVQEAVLQKMNGGSEDPHSKSNDQSINI